MSLSRRTLLSSAAAFCGASLLPACGEKPAVDSQAALDAANNVLGAATKFMLESYPETASSAGIDTGEYAHLKSRLTDRSAAGQAQIETGVRDLRAQLQAIKTDQLPADAGLNVDVVRTIFQTAADGFDFKFGDNAMLNSNWSYRPSPYVVAQNVGAFVEIPSFLGASHKIDNGQGVWPYVARLEAYAAQLDGETGRLSEDGANGYVLPDFLLEKTIGQLEGALAQDTNSWGIVAAFDGLSDGNSRKAADEAAHIAQSEIRPAMLRQMEALTSLRPKAKAHAGIWAKPEGAAYYDWALRAATTTNMSPDEVHQMGLDELAELHARMEPILQSIGYTQGTVGARMTALAADPRYHFADGDKGRAEIMDFIDDTVTEIRGLMPQAFETLVPGFLEVTRIDPAVEAGAPGAYGGAGSIDGTKPGHFWINLRDPKLHNKFGLKDLTYHEAIPGHVWQGEYTFKQPLIRSLLAFNAYSEGWALYAQQIADELGVYDDFPVGRLGYLQSLAFRACRLVVDTGLHAKRWTREQANVWFVENNGSNPEEVAGEIDRYCAWPGQACGYKVGHSAINRLRTRAQNELGDKYSYKRFNDAVVLGGGVPMSVLERVIDGYIAREKV